MTFEDVFHEINGRRPTPEETKHALALRRVIHEADLDPVLLMYLADTQAQAARERGLADVRRVTREAVERFQNVLPNIAEAERSIGALQGVQTALRNLTEFARQTLGVGALIGAAVGVLWACTVLFVWQTAYAWGRDDVKAANHRIVCADLSESIAAMSAYWRKLGYPEAAEKLGQSYDRTCR